MWRRRVAQADIMSSANTYSADSMDIKGYYINLDRSTERRRTIESQLDRLGLGGTYGRFPAIDGNPLGARGAHLKAGEIGCLVSHHALLKRVASLEQWTHVVEDDVVLSTVTFPTLTDVARRGMTEKYDLLFTDTVIPIDLKYMRHYKQIFDSNVVRNAAGRMERIRNFALVDLKGSSFAGTTSYLVNSASAAKLAGLLDREIAAGPTQPIDLFIRQKVGEGLLRAGVLVPFVTSVNLGDVLDPTIPQRNHDYLAVLSAFIIRHSFFVDCNFALCEQLLNQAMPTGDPDPHQRLLSAVCTYAIAGDVKRP